MTTEVKFEPNVIQTFSGHGYDFVAPTPDTVVLKDIAHALSNACRFAGHTRTFYSVAEHCVLVSMILRRKGYDERTQRIGLLHDAHEAYVWDCPRPFKPLLGEVYEGFAERADRVIAEKFGRARPEVFHEPPIKEADDIALVAEARALMHHGPEYWAGWQDRYQYVDDLPQGLHVHGFAPKAAEYLFMGRAGELGLEEA